MSPLILKSRIQRVVVHARGAIVTRSVTLAESLPDDTCELVVPDITPLAEPATFRALAKGSRQVVSVIPKFVVPDGPAQVGSATERLQTAEATRVALNEEKAHVTGRRNQLAGIQFNLGLDRRFQKTSARTRIGDALAMTRLVQDELAELDARIAKLDAAVNQAEKAYEAARIAEVQARSAERTGTSRPTLSCHVRLAAGQTPLEALEIEYIVLAARFWPTYKAWLTKGATRVRLELDALVVQDTGEDWTQVEMALSTADLVRDARLPELPSLRFGRATPPKKRGYRPPPVGLEGMFEAYDQAMAQMRSTATVDALRSAPPPRPAPMAAPRGGPGGSSGESAKTMVGGYAMARAADEGDGYVTFGAREEPTERAKGEARSQTRAGGFVPPPQSRSAAFQGMPSPAAAAPMKKAALMSADMMANEYEEEEAEEAEEFEGGATEFKDSGGHEPDDAWLDFDALTLPRADEPRRGKLTRAPDESVRAEALRAQRQMDAITNPARTKDPYVYRGLFDYCYEAVGRGDVPSNGRPHRVHVQAAEGPAKPRFRTVPKESSDVFREALIENPLAAPLCAGPLDVFLDGALLTTTEIAAVDRGGVVAVGLGVEDRLRVARNARVEESTVGLLGGSTHLDHYITVDITSSLGMPITIELLERIPVTDDKDVSVKIIATDPESKAYDQSDLGSPVRGGRRFHLDVAAGGKTRVSYAYRIKLPAKNEIVGGNRRE
jgi:Domain of unknown function (DUF4139)